MKAISTVIGLLLLVSIAQAQATFKPASAACELNGNGTNRNFPLEFKSVLLGSGGSASGSIDVGNGVRARIYMNAPPSDGLCVV